jgi:hypothetical protein
MAGTKAKEITKLVVASTEPLRRGEAFEPSHASYSTFHAAVVLLKPAIFVAAGPVRDTTAQRAADRPRIGAVAVCGDLIGRHARDGLGRAEEGLGRRHVTMLAQHGVDEIAIAVDGPIQVGPATTNLQVRFIHVPAPAAAGASFASHSRTAS